MKITAFNCLYISKMTRSIELIDEFVLSEPKYDFLVLSNWYHTMADNYREEYRISLCIEEEKSTKPENCIQAITMTELRKRAHYSIPKWENYKGQEHPKDLVQSISYTLSKYDLTKINPNEMIRLDYPICLRAQGSWNREDVGRHFIWFDSLGYGDVENVEYGETDPYYITHVLVRKVETIKTTNDLVEEEIAILEETIRKSKEEIDQYFYKLDLNGEKVYHIKWGDCIITDWDSTKCYAKLKYGDKLTGIISLEVAVRNKVLSFKKASIMSLFIEVDLLREAIIKAEEKKAKLESAIDTYTKWLILHEHEE